MKKSKIFAFLTAFTMVASLFSAFSVSVSAATNPVDDGLTFVAEYGGLDIDSYHVFNFKLEDTDSKLVAVTGSKKYTGNAVNKIQFVVNFDDTIFDTSEIYVTKTKEITSGLVSVSNDGVSPVKYAWVQSDDTAALATLPSEYIISVAVLTKGTYTEDEMLSGISFDGDTNYQIINFDGTSKNRTYSSIYYVDVRTGSDEISSFLAKTRIGSGSSDPKGTAITEEVDGNTGYYLSNVPLSGLSQSTMFVIKYTGSDTELNENGTKTEKRIQRNLGQILGGEFAVGTGVTGNLHFGIKLPTEKASEAVNFSVVTE